MKRRNVVGGVMRVEKVREMRRLVESGYVQREIHRITGVARSSIQEYLRTARQHKLTYEKAKARSDAELKSLLGKKTPGRVRKEAKEPEYQKVSAELHSRKGVTLELLWTEWVAQTWGGYSYPTFCRRYKEWAKDNSVTLRFEYRGGEKLLTDFAGALG